MAAVVTDKYKQYLMGSSNWRNSDSRIGLPSVHRLSAVTFGDTTSGLTELSPAAATLLFLCLTPIGH